MLEEVGLKLPNHKVRDIVEDVKSKGDTDGESMTREVFEKVINIVYQHCCCIYLMYWLQLCQELTREDVSKTFKTSKQHDKNAEKIEGKGMMYMR